MFGKWSAVTAGLCLAGTLCFADGWNKKTVLTVNETVLVPGATLTPGKYVMKLVDSLSDRHIVQITNEREDKVLTTILAIPNYRLEPTGKTQFSYWETPVGNPIALRAWFYPGDNFGQEFAYPKGLSAKISREARMPVPTIETESVPELKTAPLTETQPSGERRALAVEPYHPPVVKEPELRAEAAPAPAEPPAAEPPAAAGTEPAPAALPSTSSPYPAIGLAGLLALGAGLALRAVVCRAR